MSLLSQIILEKLYFDFQIYLFSHTPQPSDLYMLGTPNADGSPSACSRRNFALHPQQSRSITNLWDDKTELSLGRSSQCKGADTRTRSEKPSQLGTSPPFPTSLWARDIDREPEKYLGTWPLISVRALWVSLTCHMKIRNNSTTQKSDDSAYNKYRQTIFNTMPTIQWNIFIAT